MNILKKVLICVLFLGVGLWIGQYVYVPDLMADANEQIVTDDRNAEVKIPDYPTAVIPSDLRISPIIEAFGRESTARDKDKTIMITLPKDVEYINERTYKHYPMVVIDMSSPSSVLKAYTKLGNIFHRDDIANSIVNGSGDALSNAVSKVPSSQDGQKKVLYLKAPYEIPKKDTIEDNILLQSRVISIWDTGIELSGGDEYNSYVSITKEQIAEFAPDVIICKTNVGKRTVERDLKELEAVKNENVFSIEDTDYHFEFDEYHSIPAMIWLIKKTYNLDTPDPDGFYKWYLSATKSNYKF